MLRAAAVDPVCGMSVNPQSASGTATYQNQAYYFCSAGCRGKFVAHPEQYTGPGQPAAKEGMAQGVAAAVARRSRPPMHAWLRSIRSAE